MYNKTTFVVVDGRKQLPTYPYYLQCPFSGLWCHYTLQTALEVKYHLRFKISGLNYLNTCVYSCYMVWALYQTLRPLLLKSPDSLRGQISSQIWAQYRHFHMLPWTLLNHTRCFCEIDKTNRQRPSNIHCLTLARHIHAIKILNYKLFHSQVFGAHFDYTRGNWLIAHITIKSRFQNPNQLCM